MAFNSKVCIIEGCSNVVWSNKKCKQHNVTKPLPKMSSISAKRVNKVQNNEQFLLMRKFFMSIWNSNPHESEISGTYLGSEPSSAFFHHILAKEKYPEAGLDEENIIILTLDEHANVENDMYKYEIINQRRFYLKKKYNII